VRGTRDKTKRLDEKALIGIKTGASVDLISSLEHFFGGTSSS
jgi:hypothetical protein